MNIRIVFKGMDHSVPFEEHTQEQLAKKLGKLIQKESPSQIDVVTESTHANKSFMVEIRLNSHHYHLISHYRGTDLYKSLDKAVDILVDEVKRHKEKMLDIRNHTADPLREPARKND